jgi:hypothetical protein
MNSNSREFNIMFIDKEYDTPVDSSKVTLGTIVDAKYIYEDIRYTDRKGKCRFKVHYPNTAQYQVGAMKEGLLGYYDTSCRNHIGAWSFINEETGNDIILYLTSDSLNHYNYWRSITVRYPVDSLIDLLRSNNYPLRKRPPLLLWEDIPSLLAVGNSRIRINKYPVSPLSSSIQNECYLGIISLWFIESIRISERDNAVALTDKYPSLTPTLYYSGTGNGEVTSDTGELIDLTYQAYLRWWSKVKDLDKKDACKTDPLANAKTRW